MQRHSSSTPEDSQASGSYASGVGGYEAAPSQQIIIFNVSRPVPLVHCHSFSILRPGQVLPVMLPRLRGAAAAAFPQLALQKMSYSSFGPYDDRLIGLDDCHFHPHHCPPEYHPESHLLGVVPNYPTCGRSMPVVSSSSVHPTPSSLRLRP